MIPLTYRTHVIDWKRQFHSFPERMLSDAEWAALRAIPKEMRFQRQEEVESGQVFSAYMRNSKNGIRLISVEQLETDIAKERVRGIRDREIHNARGRERYRKDPQATIQRTSANRKRTWATGGKERYKRWVAANPDKIKRYNQTAGQKRVSDPRRRVIRLLRMRLRGAARQVLSGRSSDHESAAFLLWLAMRQQIDCTKGYAIDHIIPLSKCNLTTESGQIAANSPENVRWLTTEANLLKRDYMPSPEEVEAHRVLVAEWRAETQTPKELSIAA